MLLVIMMMLLAACAIWMGVIAAIAWAVQFAILNLTVRRLRFLRWVLLAVPALLACVLCPYLPFAGTLLAGTVLLGWALAWFAYKAVCGGDRKDPVEPCL